MYCVLILYISFNSSSAASLRSTVKCLVLLWSRTCLLLRTRYACMIFLFIYFFTDVQCSAVSNYVSSENMPPPLIAHYFEAEG